MRTLPTILALLLALFVPLAAATADVLDTAHAEIRAGRFAQALALLEPFATVEDPSPRALALLGATYVEIGRADDALTLLAPRAEREDADADLLYEAGRAALATEQEDRGLAYFERAHRLDATGPAARELGLLYGRRGQVEAAFPLLQSWLANHPDDTETVLGAGFAAIQLERFDEAEKLLIAGAAEEPRGMLLIANLQARRGAYASAQKTVEPLANNPDPKLNRDAKGLLFEIAIGRGDAAAVNTLLEGAPMPPPQAMRLSQAQEKRGDLEGALATLEPFRQRLITIGDNPDAPGKPQRITMAREIARLLLAAGRARLAVELLRIAVRLEPGDSTIQGELERAEAATQGGS